MKIILQEDETKALENLAGSGANGYDVMKKVFQLHIRDLHSIMNIDPKGNVGLQTISRQHAYETLLDIAEIIFPNDADDIKQARGTPKAGDTGDKPMSKWR